MDDKVTMEFKDFSLVDEKGPFPIVYMMHAAAGLTVWFKTFLPDSLMQTMSPEEVKSLISQVVDIDEWKMERDAAYKGTELYGIKNLSKIKVVKNNSTILTARMQGGQRQDTGWMATS